jgi:hypothetical protein
VTDDERARADRLAERLRDAHRRLASLELPQDEKASVARRLVALSDAAKHDVDRAALRLDRLLADLDASRTAPPRDGDGPAQG